MRKRLYPRLIWFLLGIVLGFLLSPVKGGMGNTSNHYHYYPRKQEEPKASSASACGAGGQEP